MLAQVSADDFVQLHVSPSYATQNRVSLNRVRESPCRCWHVNQADTLIRVRDGETIVLAGFLEPPPRSPHRAAVSRGFFGAELADDRPIGTGHPADPTNREGGRRATQLIERLPMHEEYYGFSEKPFSLTPDPKYLYKSESHANAFDLLQYAIRRREGFVVVTGDIGTGKTTLCRAILEQLDRKTFTALVLNPFLSEEDLLRLVLQDFGVVSREEIKRGRLAGVSKQELIDTLNEFLLSLLPLGAGALLIIDEAQNLPRPVLEQIRVLSNLETNKEKLLQIVLVGQLNLKDLLRSSDLRQLDQRVSIRYELKPLTREETSAYVAHRLTIAGGGAPSALHRRRSISSTSTQTASPG